MWCPSNPAFIYHKKGTDSAVRLALAKKEERRTPLDEGLRVFHFDVESYVTKSSEPDGSGE